MTLLGAVTTGASTACHWPTPRCLIGAAAAVPDKRYAYGEDRFQALVIGPDGKPYIVVYTPRGATMWVISFRRANTRESRSYGKEA